MLHCSVVNFGAFDYVSDAVRAVRAADVLVSMHGGDVVNGLHLLPGRSVIEVVNCGFQLAHWECESRSTIARKS